MLLWKLACKVITCGSRIHVENEELIPDGPVIFAINHPTSFDPCYVYGLTNDAAILMTQFVFDLPIVGRCVSGCGFIPVSLSGTRPRTKAYVVALNELLKGRNILIAPEGKMSGDNVDRKAHHGAVRLSYVTGYPIVPMSIRHVGKVKTFYIKDQKTRFMPRGETFIKIHPHCYVSDGDFNWHTEDLMRKLLV